MAHNVHKYKGDQLRQVVAKGGRTVTILDRRPYFQEYYKKKPRQPARPCERCGAVFEPLVLAKGRFCSVACYREVLSETMKRDREKMEAAKRAKKLTSTQ